MKIHWLFEYFYGFQFFLLVGIKWASSVWKSLEKSIREKMEKVFGGAVLIVYRPLVRSRLLTAKGDTERRSPRRSEPWRWTESLPKKPVECKEKSELLFFALRPGPLRLADPTSCQCSYVFTCSSSFFSSNINFKRKKKLRLEQQISDHWDMKSQPKAQFPTFVFLRKAVPSCCGATRATPSPSACRTVKCYSLAISLLITQKSWVASEQTLLRESIQWAISAAAFLLNPLCHDSWLWLFFSSLERRP